MIATLKDTLKNATQTPESRLEYTLIGIWLIAMIALPISYWTIGNRAIVPAITVAAVLQALAALITLKHVWGTPRALWTLAIVAIVTWGAEALGSKTGFPFGTYHYTDVLQPQLFGVPLLIPIAWFMLLPSAWALAQAIVRTNNRVAIAIVSALAFTAWDLFLDPQMVTWNFWQWERVGEYYGIPIENYLGWLLVSGLVTYLINPRPLPLMPLAIIYGCVWWLQSMGLAFFWGQPAPAFWGFIAMLSVLVIAYLRQRGASHA